MKGIMLIGIVVTTLGLSYPRLAYADQQSQNASQHGGTERMSIEEKLRRKEEELERIRKELEAKRREAEMLAGQERDLMSEIERLNDEIRANRQLLETLRAKKRVVLEDLRLTQHDLEVAQASFEAARDRLGKRLRAIYKFGRGQVMEILLTARTFADLAKRIYYLSVIAEHDSDLMREFEERLETRQILVEHIKAKKANLDAVEAEVREETRRLELVLEERDALVAKLKQKRSYYENLARKLEETSRELETVIDRLEGEGEQVKVETPFESQRGKLMWPCQGEVISEFGIETHPRFGTIIRNNGIDIKALPGTKVRAVAGGSVSFAGDVTGLGKCVIISHGGGYYSLYGHLETINVAIAYVVSQGETIGTLGETSTPEGAVLHFEIRKGKEPLDPEDWLLR